jgi:hypothetical protein
MLLTGNVAAMSQMHLSPSIFLAHIIAAKSQQPLPRAQSVRKKTTTVLNLHISISIVLRPPNSENGNE